MMEKKRQLVNVINFVRNIEGFQQLETMTSQMMICKKLKIPATFLFEYDALSDPILTEIAKRYADYFEFGLWIEITRELVLSAGVSWRGREVDWDTRGRICNTVGYAPEDRKKIVDSAMETFREKFGYYPQSVGAWSVDAVTLRYLETKYHISASCNCKEQWGTDSYTLWGGYYGQAYYPSVYNSLCPAQTEDMQINVPVFRMLGSDPIYQYDAGLDISEGAAAHQPVVTLEPVYTGQTGGGGIPSWIDWFFQENYNGKCLSFGYVQAGQEGFPWKQMETGFIYQMEKIRALSDAGKLEAVTLAEAGKWYKSSYRLSPPSAITVENDWKDENRKSYWYCCKNYRVNLYIDGDSFWIRDFHLYDQLYKERYLDATCESEGYIFDNLPVMDGNIFSRKGVRAGVYPCRKSDGRQAHITACPEWLECENTAVITIATDLFGDIEFRFAEDIISVSAKRNVSDFCLRARLCENYNEIAAAKEFGSDKKVVIRFDAEIKDEKTLAFLYNGYAYGLSFLQGKIYRDENGIGIAAEGGRIEIDRKL